MLEQRKGEGMGLLKRLFAASGLFWLWITIVVIAIDRYSKIWVENNLTSQEPLKIFSFFDLTLAYNTGAAFSFLHSASGWQNAMFITLAVGISVFILAWLYKLPANARWVSIALSFVLGGALGNAWDRFSYGYVIDFLHFHLNDWHFAIFNIADSAIFIGAVMMILHWQKTAK